MSDFAEFVNAFLSGAIECFEIRGKQGIEPPRKEGSISDLGRILRSFDRFRLALLIFLVAYAVFVFNSGFMVIQWDEMSHLRGGQLLSQGRVNDYVTSYGYYPPVYDLLTSGYFQLLGVSAESARLASLSFALLSIWVVFEFARKAYDSKTALLAGVLLGAMPGVFWTSKFALLETALIFFFTVSLFFFLSWMRTGKNKLLIATALALGVGFLAKYQVVVAGIVMIPALLFLAKDKLRVKLSRFSLLALIAILVIVPWVLIAGFNKGNDLVYAITAGGEDRVEYGGRFGPYALPIFYLIEMTWPYNNTHPIFLPLFILGLMGLMLWGYRRKNEDKFFLLWFGIVYLFFTLLIPNKQWRYVVPLFPVLAISAANFVFLSFKRLQSISKTPALKSYKRTATKIACATLAIFTILSIIYGFYDGYQWTARYVIHIPIEEATNFAVARMDQNDSIVVLCPNNSFNDDMVRFYLEATGSRRNKVWQYPRLAVDSFKPDFNATQLVEVCEKEDTKILLLYEYGQTQPFFNTSLTTIQVWESMNRTGRFEYLAFFGESPRAIYAIEFA